MRREKKCIFYCFRYQILPTSKHIQQMFAPFKISSHDELLAKKNDFFKRAIGSEEFLKSQKEVVSARLEEEEGDLYKFRIGLKRGVEIIKKDFSKHRMDNWPNTVFLINNDPKVQKLFVQHNIKVTPDVRSLVNLILKSLNILLRKYQLCVLIEPIFEARVFWDLVKENWNRITVVDFELVTPNLANISKTLPEELKEFQRGTNTQKTHLKVQSDPSSCLDLSEDNPGLSGVVSYASEGGGNIRCKIRGYKKYVETARNVKEVVIDEASIEGCSLKELKKILPELLK